MASSFIDKFCFRTLPQKDTFNVVRLLKLFSKAKLLLKKKRYQEQTLERTDNQLDNLEKMVC